MTLSDLLDATVVDYQNNGRRSLQTLLDSRLKPLRTGLALDRAVEVTEQRIEQYRLDRLASASRRGRPVAPATVNRELAALKRAFRLAVEQKRLSAASTIKLLAEHNARQGLWTRSTSRRLLPTCPSPSRTLLASPTCQHGGRVS